ncbi:terminase small subunit [uncultured Wocania sp.]|uniref:terminase small subunit n=1 Tax=uncultured Wocania sp. TaxID=2834404 RepID=UPI0030F5C7CB
MAKRIINKKKLKGPTERTLIKYKLMIDEWLINGRVGTEAYIKYNPKASKRTAEVNFFRIKERPEIQEYIKKVEAEIVERNKVSIDECVSNLAKMMRFKLSDLYEENGTLKSIHNIPEETQIAIAELSVFEEFQGIGKDRDLIGFTKKLKTIDRKGVIVELMKHLGGYKEDNQQKTDHTISTPEERDSRIKELLKIAKQQGK